MFINYTALLANLTDSQIVALEKKKNDDEVYGEIETAHLGYLGSQDTFYFGNPKGVGHIYKQTFIGIYSKVAFAKLYTTKHRLQRLIYLIITALLRAVRASNATHFN